MAAWARFEDDPNALHGLRCQLGGAQSSVPGRRAALPSATLIPRGRQLGDAQNSVPGRRAALPSDTLIPRGRQLGDAQSSVPRR